MGSGVFLSFNDISRGKWWLVILYGFILFEYVHWRKLLEKGKNFDGIKYYGKPVKLIQIDTNR